MSIIANMLADYKRDLKLLDCLDDCLLIPPVCIIISTITTLTGRQINAQEDLEKDIADVGLTHSVDA
ncbi:hypothetical protein PILCRDRAFT_10772 [Piloderma croceum F 1598]|uniref:Uncharacterized protein n=1 Tax=Piloderma croceum (strain F 1598) TaxID=765440 RepID=A0A0C3FG77_PILCF|nr:hypothetical protein PILCRDRAFT_10772 [Piloderma croceum F 1598]